MPPLVTARLTLVPFDADLVRAARHDRALLARLLGAAIPEGWPGPDFGEVLPMIQDAVERDPGHAAWVRLVVLNKGTGQTLVGDAGFLGPPSPDGSVVLGYAVVPEYRRRGIATETAQTLAGWALRQPGVTRIVAECEPDNAASIRVLDAAGFGRVAGDGALLRWERRGG